MLFKQFQDPVTSTFTYLLASNWQACLIDPVFGQTDLYLKVLAELNLQLRYVFDTHIHADHVTASGLLRKKTDCEIIMEEHSKAKGVTTKIKDQGKIKLGELEITVWHTPGHTSESACFLLFDRIFTGDTLLINGSGRTDFQAGSAFDSYHSIMRILSLPDEFLIYPGHDYNHRMVSTIGEQKNLNPRIVGKSLEEYIVIMDNLNLPKPKAIDESIPLNMNCGLEK